MTSRTHFDQTETLPNFSAFAFFASFAVKGFLLALRRAGFILFRLQAFAALRLALPGPSGSLHP
jgi:hypothetical protein